MIQDRPICFECEKVVEHDPVFAPPFGDDMSRESAVFHGLCLMQWREKREELIKRMREAHTAFLRHLNGDCDHGP